MSRALRRHGLAATCIWYNPHQDVAIAKPLGVSLRVSKRGLKVPTLEGSGAAQFAPTIKDERNLFNLVNESALGNDVIDIILPHGKPLEYEASLWDYKRTLPNVSGKLIQGADEPSDVATAEIIKDVVAFHNSFGGYILGGIQEKSENALVGCANTASYAFNVEKLNERIAAYTKTAIKCRFRTIEVGSGTLSDPKRCLGLLHIPRREEHAPVVQMMKGAPEVDGRSAFRKGDIFARLDDKCLSATNDNRVLPFVCSSRMMDLTRKEVIDLAENNLPPRDPNLVRFVGRSEYLGNLWNWLVELNSPLKVLTALGGTGKTAIAYEFCQQLIQNKPSWVNKIVWLSAKRQTYSAIQGKKYAASRVDFSDVPSFFAELVRELGGSEEEIGDCSGEVDDLIGLSFDYLTELPALVVIDDIDTLSLEEQGELFSQIQSLSGRTFANGTRFLITSRLEFGGASQRIEVKGFPEREFRDYVALLSEQTGINLSEQVVDQLRRASLGSPVFAASIFRLVSLGMPIHRAIKDWKGRAGEDVRRFAFEREIAQLTDAEARTLFALVTLGETTQIELSHVLEIDQQQLLQHLSKIREFHLFATNDSLASGSKLTVPAPITLMGDVIRQRVNDPTRIEKECARARSKSPKIGDRVSPIIGEVLALWKEEELDDALLIAQEGVKQNPKSGDLPCLLGRCQLLVRPSRPKEADKSFGLAATNGCTRIELAPLWIEAKRLLQDWVGISELAETLPQSDIRGPAAFTVSLAEANLGMQASARGDVSKAIERFRRSMQNAQITIRDGRADEGLPELREIARESAKRYVSLTDRETTSPGDRLRVFDAVVDAFHCHISEGNILLLGGISLTEWARDVFLRDVIDERALAILETRLERLKEIVHHVSDADFGREWLASKLNEMRLKIEEDLSHFRVVAKRQRR